jgi:hypothetical protein
METDGSVLRKRSDAIKKLSGTIFFNFVALNMVKLWHFSATSGNSGPTRRLWI